MSLTGDDIVKRLQSLAAQRVELETYWKQVAEVAATDVGEIYPGQMGGSVMDLGMRRANAARRSKNVYDGTAAWALDRLASGLEGLMMAQSELWHTLETNDLYAMRHAPTDEEAEWFERLTKYLFRIRYDSASGWQAALQTSLRRLVGFGNGLMFVEEGHGGHSLIRYRHLPVMECYLTEDAFGRLDGVWRVYQISARQAAQKVKLGIWKTVPPTVEKAANDPNRTDTLFTFIHVIAPREDFGSYDEGVQRAPWASYHVGLDDKVIVGESGYWEFPVIDFRWLPEPGRVYGEGPIMRVLSDIQSLNLIAKNELVSAQQSSSPPLLVARNGVVNRPNTNPNSIIVGGLDAQGREMVKPMNLGQRIDLAQAVIQAKRENLRESLYINLFATMVQNPRMSATEAMIKANEKGELLGPAGSRIQESLSRLIERELGILMRFGLFGEGSVFQPPRSLQGRSFGPKFQSQLDRIRRSKEAESVIRTMEIAAPILQIDMAAAENFDSDKTIRGVAEVLGVPRQWMKREEEVAQARAEKAQQQQMMMQLQAAEQAATAAKNAAPALQALNGG